MAHQGRSHEHFFDGITILALKIVTSGDQVIWVNKVRRPNICRHGIVELDNDVANS